MEPQGNASKPKYKRGECFFLEHPRLFGFWLSVFEKRKQDSDGKPIPEDKQRYEFALAWPKAPGGMEMDPLCALIYNAAAHNAGMNFGDPRVCESTQIGNKRFIIKDGDAPRFDKNTGAPQPPREFLRGHWYVNVKSYDPVRLGVLEPSGILRDAFPSDLYPGAIVKAAVHMRASAYMGNLTVSLYAESLVKMRDAVAVVDRSGGGNRSMEAIWGVPVQAAPQGGFGQAPQGGFGQAPQPQAPAFGQAPGGFGQAPTSTMLPPAMVQPQPQGGFGQASQPQGGFGGQAPQPAPTFAPPGGGFGGQAPQPAPTFAPPGGGFGQAPQPAPAFAPPPGYPYGQ